MGIGLVVLTATVSASRSFAPSEAYKESDEKRDRGTKQESARPDDRMWAALTKLGDDILNADIMYDTAWMPRNIALRL